MRIINVQCLTAEGDSVVFRMKKCGCCGNRMVSAALKSHVRGMVKVGGKYICKAMPKHPDHKSFVKSRYLLQRRKHLEHLN